MMLFHSKIHPSGVFCNIGIALVFKNDNLEGQGHYIFVVGQKSWHGIEGLATRNAYVKYESPISSGKEAMAKVKVFFKVGQTPRSM